MLNSNKRQRAESESLSITLSSDDTDDMNDKKPSTYEIIDLCTPVKATNVNNNNNNDNSVVTCKKIKEYIPKTINENNQGRLSILPTFPTTIHDQHPHLLLANIPNHNLSIEQFRRRQQQQQQQQNNNPTVACTFTINNNLIPSAIVNYYQKNYQSLIDRLHINWQILDYNYTRLDYCLKLFTDERISRLRQTAHETRLLDAERLVAMEFFLQMDVDLFYIKTFSYRNIQSSIMNRGLFCNIEPEIRFTMKPCRQQNCRICSLAINQITNRPQSSVNFEDSGTYKFLNGYQTILNAPVTCNTNGIIYVLKCPCGKFEYIGETSNNLLYTLDRHRANGNRALHYFLIGENENINNISFDPNLFENNQKKSMHLYQHSPRCPVMMQMFLNCYPHYWQFVPMATSIVQQQNADYIKFPSTLLPRTTMKTIATTTSTTDIRNDQEIRSCLQNVPLPPRDYQFSEEQHDRQTEFFRNKKDLQLPDLPLDLYNASILTILPEKTSPVLRQFLASLFITHGETKLNSIGNLLATNYTNSPFTCGPFRGNWCHDLRNHSFMTSPSPSSATSASVSLS